MTISSQENHHFSLCSYFHAHPTTLLLKILGGDQCMGRPPTSNFGEDRPPSPPRSPPLIIKHICSFKTSSPESCCLYSALELIQLILFSIIRGAIAPRSEVQTPAKAEIWIEISV